MSRTHPGFRVQLCEFAVSNADGTYTVVRGDMLHWTAVVPFTTTLYVFADCQKDVLPGGAQACEIWRTPPGADAVQWWAADLFIERGKSARFSLGSPIQFDRYGLWRFEVRCGGFRAETTLDVRSPTPVPSA